MFKDIISNYLGISRSKEGRAVEESSTYYTTPVAWRDEDGLWVGHNGEVWLYREIPVAPITWEDPGQKLAVERPLDDLLHELAATSRDTGGLRTLSKSREIHLLTITGETDARVPKGSPERLKTFIEELLYFTIPARAVLVGVKLWSSLTSDKSLVEQAKSRLTSVMGENGPDLAPYDADRKIVTEILERNGGHLPSKSTISQMEGWYNYGRGTDITVYETEDGLIVGPERIEMAALMSFNEPKMYAPHAQWGLTAQTHSSPITVASIRGVLDPPGVSRNRLRRSQRKVVNQIDEEEASGDIDRPENSAILDLAQESERFILSSREPLVSSCSITLGRRVEPGVFETYVDELRNVHAIEVKPLPHRQMAALEETLPTSSRRINPFLQDVSIGMLAYAGFQGFSTLGDRKGAYLGLVDPDYVPFYLDFLGAPANNKPPGLLIAGDPGSGKAMPLDHRILTPSGWRRMGDLAVGDSVYGADGQAHAVTGVYPQGEIPVFQITFSDGSTADCCDDHLWAVRSDRDLSNKNGWEVKTLAQIRADGLTDGDGNHRWYIPIVKSVEFEEQELPLEPYLLGVLLGAGNMAKTVTVSGVDEETVDELRRQIPAACEIVHRAGRGYTFVRADRGQRTAKHLVETLGWSQTDRSEHELPAIVYKSTGMLHQFLSGMLASTECQTGMQPTVSCAPLIGSSAAALADVYGIEGVSWDATSSTLRLDGFETVEWSSTPVAAEDAYLLGIIACCRQQNSNEVLLRISEEVAGTLEQRCVTFGATRRSRTLWKLRSRRATNEIKDAVTHLGLSGGTTTAHIPHLYLRGSISQRTAILQGLMDSCGTTDSGEVTFNTSSQTLVADVKELVQLLGGTAHDTTPDATLSECGSQRETGTAGARYRLTIRLPKEVAPFRLESKRRVWESAKRQEPARAIVSIAPVGIKAAQCISVDAADRLYVADQGVVTHNTFLASVLAIQATFAGLQTIFVNPKPSDSLAPMANYAGGRVVRLTEIEKQGGFFDPFRFVPATPEGAQVAADIAAQHILAVLGSRGVGGLGFNQEQEIALIAGLREGAARGARCVAQALAYVPDQQVQYLVQQQAADPLFRLGISMEPVERYQTSEGMLLVEFDRPLDIPEKGVTPAEYTRTQRLAIAAVRLVTRASLEILAGSKGGVLIVDEAWMYLQSSEGLAALQSLGRMGRSQNILPVFATQRVDDLLREGADMEGYLSRVFAMQLADEREARAALRLVGLEATQGRINWLKQAGPRRGEEGRPGRPAMGLHRDLHGRHAAVMFGPFPEHVRLAISTNPEDRKRRDEQDQR